jgi:hypothetical protein
MVGNQMSEIPFNLKSWPAGLPETFSGSGSKYSNTENVRNFLPEVLSKYNIRSIFDSPCGDRNWIKTINFKELNCVYKGGDIIEDLVKQIDLESVTLFDLRTDAMPDVDLWFCRDCLYHLSVNDIKQVINNALSSNIRYFLITSHINNEQQHNSGLNRDIDTGAYRCLILEQHDYFGLPTPLERFYDCAINLAEEMLLFENPNFKDK